MNAGMGAKPPGQLRVLVQQRRHMRNAVDLICLSWAAAVKKTKRGMLPGKAAALPEGFFQGFSRAGMYWRLVVMRGRR